MFMMEGQAKWGGNDTENTFAVSWFFEASLWVVLQYFGQQNQGSGKLVHYGYRIQLWSQQYAKISRLQSWQG